MKRTMFVLFIVLLSILSSGCEDDEYSKPHMSTRQTPNGLPKDGGLR